MKPKDFKYGEDYINHVIATSKLTYDQLMLNLQQRLDDTWEFELYQLKDINVFELTDEQHARKIFLESAVKHSDRLLWKHKHVAKIPKSVTITGNNLKVLTVY